MPALCTLALGLGFGLGLGPASGPGPVAAPERTPAVAPDPDPPKASKLSFDIAALARLAVFAGQTRQLTQPWGYGVGLDVGIYPWRPQAKRARVHLGFFVFGGHARAPQLLRLASGDDPQGSTFARWQRVTHTDFAGGLALRADFARLYWGMQVGAGVAISEFVRPTEARFSEDESFRGLDPSLRVRANLGVPFGPQHGLVLGLAFNNVFSGVSVPLVSTEPEGETAFAFDLLPEFDLGYQARF